MGLSLNQLTTTSGKIKQKEEFDKKKKHLKIIQIFVWSNHGARSGPAFCETDVHCHTEVLNLSHSSTCGEH